MRQVTQADQIWASYGASRWGLGAGSGASTALMQRRARTRVVYSGGWGLDAAVKRPHAITKQLVQLTSKVQEASSQTASRSVVESWASQSVDPSE